MACPLPSNRIRPYAESAVVIVTPGATSVVGDSAAAEPTDGLIGSALDGNGVLFGAAGCAVDVVEAGVLMLISVTFVIGVKLLDTAEAALVGSAPGVVALLPQAAMGINSSAIRAGSRRIPH